MKERKLVILVTTASTIALLEFQYTNHCQYSYGPEVFKEIRNTFCDNNI